MGSIGKSTANKVSNLNFKDRTNSVDDELVMNGAYFKNNVSLYATINRAENGRFDIISNYNRGDYGTITYMDGYASDNVVYEADWQRDYSDPERRRIQVIRFRRNEDYFS